MAPTESLVTAASTTGIDGTAVPVAVVGVGGTGTLRGRQRESMGGNGQLLRRPYFGGVGLLGNGYLETSATESFAPSGNESSATPVAVAGVGGTGTLSGVASVTSDGMDASYCAVHFGGSGLLGRWPQWGAWRRQLLHDRDPRQCYPCRRDGCGRRGDAVGVTKSDERRRRELLPRSSTSGGVDCWGDGNDGQVGDGSFYTTGNDGTAVPVAVVGVGGTGTLSAVSSVASDGSENYCAALTSGEWIAGRWRTRPTRRRHLLHDGERRHCRPCCRGGCGRYGDAVGGVKRAER